MADTFDPKRGKAFRLATAALCALGGFVLAGWGINIGLDPSDGLAFGMVRLLLAALCALTAMMAALAFFAGVDESARYYGNRRDLDRLTGLPGRTLLLDRIGRAAANSIASGTPAFLIDIDVNRFKAINEAIGYDNGNELIRALAERIGMSAPDLVVGRIGAGEFAILYPDGGGRPPVDRFIEELIDTLSRPCQLGGHLQPVNLSVGMSSIPKDGSEPELLMRRANLALQHARTLGVGGWAAFQPEMAQVADYRQWIESELDGAFRRGEFTLHYQPQYDLESGDVVGYEALMRWRHPIWGLVSPTEFIPIAEDTGMIVPIGAWALRQACADLAFMPDDCFVAVNISAVQFMTRDFAAQVEAVLRDTGIEPSRLELEITETAMMQDHDRAALVLKQLCAMGITVAVDDFGTGYSNLSYLIDFSFHKIKIDRSFVARLGRNDNAGIVIATIVALARALDVTTIAEGVETQEQALLLRAAGCRVVQGYFYGVPGPLPALPPLQRPKLRAIG